MSINFGIELEKLEQSFREKVAAYLSGGLTEAQKIRLVAELEFFQELEASGLTSILDELENEYVGIIEGILKNRELGVSPFTLQDLELIKDLDAESILRSAEQFSTQFKSRLLKGFIAGEDTLEIIKNSQDFGLKTNQLISAINTARDQFNATATAKLFEDEPETRFRLSDYPLDDVTRCACRAVITNQPAEGWTKQEIDEGAATRIARQFCPKFEGEYSFIERGGFNCRHVWEIL